LPAGIIGDDPGHADEAHADAARRELIEETGYDAGSIAALAHGPASSGLTSETVTLFLATALRRVAAGGGILHEAITVHEVPVVEVDEWLDLKAKSGVLVDPKVYAGLYFIGRDK
jgi:ADP-ribose pyrophosphatase